MKKLAKMALAAAIAGFGLAAQAAVVLIDDFEIPGPNLTIDATVLPKAVYDTQAGLGIIGGNRDLFLSRGVGGNARSNASFGVIDGELYLDTDANVNAWGAIRWDGGGTSVDNIGFGDGNYSLNQNLSSETSFQLDVSFADQPYAFTIAVFNSASQWSALTVAGKATTGSTYGIDFSSFGGSAFNVCALGYDCVQTVSRDWQDILGEFTGDSWGLKHGATAVNFSQEIDMIQVFVNWSELAGVPTAISPDLVLVNASAVPEPESLALVGLGLLGLAASRRRKAVK